MACEHGKRYKGRLATLRLTPETRVGRQLSLLGYLLDPLSKPLLAVVQEVGEPALAERGIGTARKEVRLQNHVQALGAQFSLDLAKIDRGRLLAGPDVGSLVLGARIEDACTGTVGRRHKPWMADRIGSGTLATVGYIVI